jgi:hypothetical protein
MELRRNELFLRVVVSIASVQSTHSFILNDVLNGRDLEICHFLLV